MAWIFMLAADCNTIKQAELFAQYFDGKTLTSPYSYEDHYDAPLTAEIFRQDNAHWVRVIPAHCGDGGLNHGNYMRLNYLSHKLYDLLKAAPPFRFALVGVEAEAYRTYEEILEEGTNASANGLVVNNETWKKLGRPTHFSEFSAGYKWIPFRDMTVPYS